jgi:UMF1 family MFS transporter
VQRGDWLLASVLFVLANIGANGSFVFYDALLPHVARPEELDRVSTAGYALGYVGGGLLLALDLLLIQRPDLFGLPSGEGLTPEQATLPSRLAFLSVALWWGLFSLPLVLRVPEPPLPARGAAGGGGARRALAQLAHTFRALRAFRQALLMLLAFLVYNDGIGTIIRMAAIYGTELGLERGVLIGAILLVQFVGIPFTLLAARLAARIGAKRTLLLSLGVYAGISVLGYHMRTAAHFYVLAALVALVQGGSQALSRSLFASMVPRHQSGEFFGFFAVSEKFAGLFGPALFALAVWAGGSSRTAILSVIAFFAVGGALLWAVDVEAGQRAARAAEDAHARGPALPR